MDVISLSPLRTGSLVWQRRRGSWVMTAVCKATYALLPTESKLAPEQEYPNEDDNHWNDDDARSLYSPSDLVPFKPRADVMLVGHAFAPRKEPVRSVVARLLVGEVDKAVEVWADRSFAQDGTLREGPRFARMPLRWERAAGGPETQNPVGMRLDARPDTYGAVPVPNLQRPGLLLASPKDFLEPICFGPIAWTWPARRDRLGRHAATWSSSWSREPLPEDVDPGFFNAAPRDQQLDALRPDERIVLENLHPEHARLVTNLPGIAPRAFVERRGAAPQEVLFVADTLWIDTDRSICTLTWRAQIPIDHPTQPGRVLIAMAEPGQRLGWADVERMAAAAHGPEHTEATSTQPRADGPAPSPPTPPPRPPTTLPFVPSAAPEPPKKRRDPLGETHDGPANLGSALPFAAPSPPWLRAAPATPAPVPPPPVRPASMPPGSPFGAPPAAPVFGPPPIAVPRAPGARSRDAVDLLWFDAAALPRLRAAYKAILDGKPTAPEIADRRDVTTILARGEATDPDRLHDLVADAVDDDGAFLPPLVLTAGELVLPFDEIAQLEATVAAVTPFAGEGEDLADAVDGARVLLEGRALGGSPGAAEGLTARLREAFQHTSRAVPPSYLDAQTERVLLAQRRFQKRAVFGETCVRALLGAVPAYLPDALAQRLPLYTRFRARILAEAHLAQDQYETHPTALKVIALARVMPLRR
jgi:hypothetical protein